VEKQMSINEGALNAGMSPSVNMPVRNQSPAASMQERPMANAMMNPVVYPEIFYKLQPYIMLVCDQMDTFSPMMPTQDMIEQMTDSIYDDVCRMYPDIAEYARANENKVQNDPPSVGVGFGVPFVFGNRFRRRGLLRDLIDILLISEFARRRRRFF
jgi:hypothetical protein